MSRLRELVERLCPVGVEYRKMGSFCECFSGATPKKSDSSYWEGGTIPWMSSGEVHQHVVTHVDGRITQAGYDSCSTRMVPAGTVVVALAGQGKTRGTVAITTIDLCTNQSIGAVLCDETVDSKYLYYYLSGQYDYLRRISSGEGTRGGLNMPLLRNLDIPVPPLEVQREVVRILDSFQELDDALTAEIEARERQLDECINRFLYEDVQDGRQTILLDMLSKPITDGPHTTPELYSEGIPFISAEAVSVGRGHIDFSHKRGYISKEFNEECCKKYKPMRDDVYMVKSGSTTGRVAIVETDDVFNIWSPLAAMRVSRGNSARYLFYLLQTHDIQRQVSLKCSQGSQPNLSMRTLERFEVLLPSLDYQQRVVCKLDSIAALIDILRSERDARRKQFAQYRDRLLSFPEREA